MKVTRVTIFEIKVICLREETFIHVGSGYLRNSPPTFGDKFCNLVRNALLIVQ